MLDLTSPNLPPALGEPFSLMEDAYRRLTRIVQGMSQEELEYTGPAGNVNSTAMLIAHLSYADLMYLHLIKGEPVPPELEAEFGPFETEEGLLPPVSGKTAAELLSRGQRMLEMVREYLQTLPAEAAMREVHVPWWPQPATLRYILWHVAGHSRFHQGQIARLQGFYRQEAAR